VAIRIFIDQGHNPSGWNTGAEGSGLREQDVTFVVGAYLADLLDQDPRFDVRVSRDTPDTVLGTSNASSLTRRVDMANSWPADYFLSIHCNASTLPSANGTEACVYAQYTQSYWLGEHILHAIVSSMGTRDRGMSLRPGLYVLRKTQMPSVLIELAFITNAEDAALLASDPYGFAAAIYEGLLSYFDMAPLKE
jgi:N-acetylmuramoyl-L-alanine amidase